MNKIVIISGATASGKSAFGVNIAKKIGGEIISCDSMQIYKSMNIGTAKISLEEMQGVRHHLLDIVEPFEDFSVGQYAMAAKPVIDELLSKGITPVVVGGTGLYIDAILYPMSFGGNKNEDIRRALEEDVIKYGKEYMHKKLAAIDPQDAAKIHHNNVKRVLRALEIYYTTGKCKSDMLNSEKEMQYECIMTVLDRDREKLYSTIDLRVEKMFESGLEREVEDLIAKGVSFKNQSMQAIGYKEFENYFSNEIDIDCLKDKIKQNTRNYAKKQITWLKKYSFAKWFNAENELNKAEEYIIENLRG